MVILSDLVLPIPRRVLSTLGLSPLALGLLMEREFGTACIVPCGFTTVRGPGIESVLLSL